MKPLVSILIPVYNRVSLIEETICSAMNQNYENLEIIISDNNSTDGTAEKCYEISKTHKNIKFFQNKDNLGPVANWQKCTDEASGMYSKILFSDDLLLPNCIEQMVSAIADQKVGLVFSSVLIGKNLNNCKIYYKNKFNLLNADIYPSLVLLGKAPVSPGGILIRTDDLRANLIYELPNEKRYQYKSHGAGPDLLISLLTIKKYEKIRYIDDCLIFFRKHPNSITIMNQENLIHDGYDSIWELYFKSFSDLKKINSYFSFNLFKKILRINRIGRKKVQNYYDHTGLNILNFLKYLSLHAISLILIGRINI